jgi:hypothetical protein
VSDFWGGWGDLWTGIGVPSRIRNAASVANRTVALADSLERAYDGQIELVERSKDAEGRVVVRKTTLENKFNCSGFVKGVLKDTGQDIPSGLNADGLIDYWEANWTRVQNIEMAIAAANGGQLVVAGLKSTDYTPAKSNGHVVVVIPTRAEDLYRGTYPKAWGGDIGKKYMSRGNKSVGEIFSRKMRDSLRFYTP